MDNKRKEICDEVTVYLDTSVHTRLATTVSGGDTILQLKSKLESEHQDLFGGIKIQFLKINWNGSLYSLSNSMHVRRAVGNNDECHLFAEALSLDKNEESRFGSRIESKDVSRDIMVGIKDTTSRDVSCDMAVGNTSALSDSGGLEETEPSEKNESEAKETEKHKVPDKDILKCDMCGGNHYLASCGYWFDVPPGAYVGPLYVVICYYCGTEVECRRTGDDEDKWFCQCCGGFLPGATADLREIILFTDPSSPENLI